VQTVPRLCKFYPAICLKTEEKARKNLSQGKKNLSLVKKNLSQSTVYILPKHPHITKPTQTQKITTSPPPHTHTHTHTLLIFDYVEVSKTKVPKTLRICLQHRHLQYQAARKISLLKTTCTWEELVYWSEVIRFCFPSTVICETLMIAGVYLYN